MRNKKWLSMCGALLILTTCLTACGGSTETVVLNNGTNAVADQGSDTTAESEETESLTEEMPVTENQATESEEAAVTLETEEDYFAWAFAMIGQTYQPLVDYSLSDSFSSSENGEPHALDDGSDIVHYGSGYLLMDENIPTFTLNGSVVTLLFGANDVDIKTYTVHFKYFTNDYDDAQAVFDKWLAYAASTDGAGEPEEDQNVSSIQNTIYNVSTPTAASYQVTLTDNSSFGDSDYTYEVGIALYDNTYYEDMFY